MQLIQLSQNNLSKLTNVISVPKYDRTNIITNIVHIGVGGFHRSHQAYYIHGLLEVTNHLDWAICGMWLRPNNHKIYHGLKRQNGLYTLMTQHPIGNINCEVIGSVKELIFAYEHTDIALDKLTSPSTKIVSLTITEGGYNFDPNTGNFNFDNPDVIEEINNPNSPKTIYGYLSRALLIRKQQNLPAFTILSCDNIQHNGDLTKKMLLSFIAKVYPDLQDWVETNVQFPNTMVDRITPVTSINQIKYLEEKYSLFDEWPVICEPYIQWVVEDKFSNGRPPLEKLGVQFVSDVAPYEKMKLRLLNAGHSVLGIPGAIHGFNTIDDCMADRVFAIFMRNFMDLEATPILDPVEGVNIEEYKNSLEERFSNPNLKDQVSRICSQSSAKLPKFLIPTINENLNSGGSIKYGTFILAAWCYYSDKGINDQGNKIEIIDDQALELHTFAQSGDPSKTQFLKMINVFGDLIENEKFITLYKRIINRIYKAKNIHRLMEELIDGSNHYK